MPPHAMGKLFGSTGGCVAESVLRQVLPYPSATGVQVIPSVPFLQAIGMEKEELIQALGVFFTVATLALGLNLTGAGLLTVATALPGAVALAASFAGMFIGQAVRTRLQPDIFRRWFQIGMIVLGLYLATNAFAKLMS